MARTKKDGVSVAYKIATDINDMINELSDETGCSKTGIVERAIRAYYEKEKNAKEANKNDNL